MTLPPHRNLTRRRFLRSSACGFGSVALAAMCTEQAAAAAGPLAPKVPHIPPRVKRVIFMWMAGGPSQLDMFDYKPRLAKESGEAIPYEIPDGVGMDLSRLMGPISPMRPQGQSGLMMTDWLPHMAKHADELCLLRAMQADSEAHAPAARQLHTGDPRLIRPSMGSWVGYGLGTENRNLPSFVTICPLLVGDTGNVQFFGNAFLPAIYQGTALGNRAAGAEKAVFRYIEDPSLPVALQRDQVDFIQQMNGRTCNKFEPTARWRASSSPSSWRFECSRRLRISSTCRPSRRPHSISTASARKRPTNSDASGLLARRFAEAGVRFIQITSSGWDHHEAIGKGLPKKCAAIDKPTAGLITDLKTRGLFDDTLLVWSGEFGRTPHFEDFSFGDKSQYGRGHNPEGFCAWMAGGGVRGGMVHGVTDEYGLRAVDQKVHIHDLHATILHLLGLDHERLTYRYSGRDFRLTDVYGRVVKEVLA